MEFWSEQGIREIGDQLGSTILVDGSFVDNLKRSVARVLVDLDLSKGLYESIELISGWHCYTQLLDYVLVPFRYFRCHAYGHILVYYPNSFTQKDWRKVTKEAPQA